MFSANPNPLILKAFQASVSRVYVLNIFVVVVVVMYSG